MKPNRGMLLICVLVCLGVVSTITGIMVQSSLRARRQMKHHWQLEQTLVLLDAGIRRTIEQSHAGEQDWNRPWDVSDAFSPYSVAKISVDTEGLLETTRVRVTAEIHSDSETPTVTRRSRTINLAKPKRLSTDSETTPEQDD